MRKCAEPNRAFHSGLEYSGVFPAHCSLVPREEKTKICWRECPYLLSCLWPGYRGQRVYMQVCVPSPQLFPVLTFLWVCFSSDPVPRAVVSFGCQRRLSPHSSSHKQCRSCLPWYMQQDFLQDLVSLDILCNLRTVPLILGHDVPFREHLYSGGAESEEWCSCDWCFRGVWRYSTLLNVPVYIDEEQERFA